LLALLYVLGFAALYFTYSRSAWLGVFAATAWLVWGLLHSQQSRRLVLVTGAAAVLAFAGVGYALRDNDNFQNLFFHTNEHSKSAESSNAGHFRAATEGVGDILRQPQGGGPGSAGPASFYASHTRIAENYFVQIGQELGTFGLGMFVAINVIVAVRLWRGRGLLLNEVLLASFIGLTLVNLLLHAWADDTLAYIWWGLAGAAIGHQHAQD
jgi:O-antigen ligase